MVSQRQIARAMCIAVMTASALSSPGQEIAPGAAEAVARIMTVGSDEFDPQYMLERMAELAEQPVKINSGSEKELSRLFFLTEFQVRYLADHVMNRGEIMSVYELALLPLFDRATAELIASCADFSRRTEGASFRHSESLVMANVSAGLTPYGGARVLLRARHETGSISMGLTAENDPGERFSFSDQTGADFLSGHLMYRGKRLIDRIIIGDYALRFGEGLLFNSGSWQGAWLSSPSFMTGRSAVSPYTSTDENSFFRGVACTAGDASAGASFFISSNSVDARILTDESGTQRWVRNLVSGGLHVSASSLEARDRLTETIAGMSMTAGGKSIRGTVTAAQTWFSLPFMPDTSRAEGLKAFRGDRLFNLSGSLKAGTGSLLVFTEAGVSFPGSWAVTAGARVKPSSRLTLNLLVRHYEPDYYAFHSGAFRSAGSYSGECGIALSVQAEVARHLFVTAATDQYRIPWMRYRSSGPSSGSRTELTAEYLPGDKASLRLSLSSSSRDYDLQKESGIASPQTVTRQCGGMVFSLKVNEMISLVTRASVCRAGAGGETGGMLSQDITLTLPGPALRLWLRHALCSTGGYDSRLYAWENDLLWAFSIPALYGESSRSCAMISWKPFSGAEIRLKYSVTLTDDGQLPKRRGEVRGQVRIMF